MSSIRTGVLLTAVTALVVLPGPSTPPEPAPEDIEIFYGVVSAVDGKVVRFGDSKLSLSVEGPPGVFVARNYRLYVDCEDLGFQSRERDGAWTSFAGSAGAEYASIVQCPEADPALYNRVVEIMGVGGELELSDDEVVLTSRLGEARFKVSARPID